MHTPMPASSLRPPRAVSFRKNLGGGIQKPSNSPKVKTIPSTAKKLPIVGISA